MHVDEEEPKKLPLNDTVQKEDPDAFANKIKQAVLRYDNEMKNQMEAEAQQKPNGNEINESFHEATYPDYSDSKESANDTANKEEISKNNDYKDDEFEDEEVSSKKEEEEEPSVKKDSKNSSISSSPVFNKSDTNRKSSTPSPSPTVETPASPSNQTNPKRAASPSSQPSSPSHTQTKNTETTRNDREKEEKEKEEEEITEEKKSSSSAFGKYNRESTVIASVEDSNQQQTDEKLKVPKQSIKKIPSFSASSKVKSD